MTRWIVGDQGSTGAPNGGIYNAADVVAIGMAPYEGQYATALYLNSSSGFSGAQLVWLFATAAEAWAQAYTLAVGTGSVVA